MKQALLSVLLLGSFGAVADQQPTQVTISHPPTTIEQIDKVYIDNGSQNPHYSDDNCVYVPAHHHLHCYADDNSTPGGTTPIVQRTVVRQTIIQQPVIRNRPLNSNVVIVDNGYRRGYYGDPIATGLGVGLAVGIPLAIYGTNHNFRPYSPGYHRHFRSNRGSHYSSWRHGNNRWKYRRGGRH